MRLASLLFLSVSLLFPFKAYGALETDKWTNQQEENQRFCGTTEYQVVTARKVCQSFWLPPVDLFDIALSAGLACAVCWAPSTCIACSMDAVFTWFADWRAKLAGAMLDEMPRIILDLAGVWLRNLWDALINGSVSTFTSIGGFKISVRSDVKNHCSRECETICLFGCSKQCLPRTCGQYQGFVQVKAEREGHFIRFENGCEDGIYAAVRYLDSLTNQWVSSCWYDINSGEGIHLADEEGDRLVTDNSVIYIFAYKKSDPNFEWEGNDADAVTRTCRGRQLKMRKMTYVDARNDLSVRFTCNSGTRKLTEALDSDYDWVESNDTMVYMGGWEAESPGLGQASSNLRSGSSNITVASDDPTFWLAEPPQEYPTIASKPTCGAEEHSVQCDQAMARSHSKSIDFDYLVERVINATGDEAGGLLTQEQDEDKN